MDTKRNKILLILTIVMLMVLSLGIDTVAEDKSKLEVHYIDVGQGDSALIKLGNSAMLIDAGTNGQAENVVNYLKNEGIESLEYVIGTHPHEDHIGGLDDVIKEFDVDNVLMPNVTHNTKTFEDVLDAIMEKGLFITEAFPGDVYDLGDASFTILAPNSEEYSNLNNYSIAIKLVYGNTSFIFTGDAEKESEREMIEKFGTRLKSDVMQLGHHGSDTSNTQEFLNKVRPDLAVITTGKDNKYNHPSDSVVKRLEDMKIKYYDTKDVGNILIKSDGEIIELEDGYTVSGGGSFIDWIIDLMMSILELFE